MNHPETQNPINGIAIIGMSGRFPLADDVEEFWGNICQGRECITFLSDEELAAEGIDSELYHDESYVRAKGLMADLELFDAAFFGYSPREAEVIDPQQRVFLECAWAALENAGYDPSTYSKSIGVFGGASANTYLINNLLRDPSLFTSVGGYQMMIGNDKDFLTTRVSYKLNLRGPSVCVQTACSTSLVAVQMAYQSLSSYECDMALAGGVSASLPHKSGYAYKEGMILSPDGHCRPFDAEAQGIVPGEGVGIVVLKRLEDALADGDHIYAVIKGASINNDGSDKVGYTAPGVNGQAEVIATAQALAGVEPDTITYVEAHGTGTALGDPIEIAGLTQAFGLGTSQKQYCAIGAVKSAIGHLDVAAGVAGLIKTTLMLEHKMLPSSVNLNQINPTIDFENSPFYVNRELRQWTTEGGPRRAGVSSFGIGGTNAHAVLEEAPEKPATPSSRTSHLLPLSARSETALKQMADNLAQYLAQHLARNLDDQPDLELGDVAYTLQVGRKAFKHRAYVVADSLAKAVSQLREVNPSTAGGSARKQGKPSVAFMFPGQGSQYANMARGLYQSELVFKAQVDQCAELLKPQLDFDLREVLYPSADSIDSANQRLQQTAITQPALFVVEYALARLLMSWGIEPEQMIGHSIGEYVAACLAGVFSLEDALMLVCLRGKIMQQLPGGSMLAISLPETNVRRLLDSDLALAAVNGPNFCVISGPTQRVDQLEAKLISKGIGVRRLHTSHAFHSSMMDPVVETFRQAVSKMTLNVPTMPFVSNVTGTMITAQAATDPSYWARHLRQTVRFADGIHTLDTPDRLFLEVGPGQTLTTLVKQTVARTEQPVVVWPTVRHLRDGSLDTEFLMNTLGHLWQSGVSIEWQALYAEERRQRVPLPSYPFERQRYWVEPQAPMATGAMQAESLASESEVADCYYVPIWKQSSSLLPGPRSTKGSCPQRWLAFVDECHIGSELVQTIAERGDEVITVAIGSEFRQVTPNSYVLNPLISADYEALLRALVAAKRVPEHIVHLWEVTESAGLPLEDGELETTLSRGFYSLFFLAQKMGDLGVSPERIHVITSGVQSVMGDEPLSPAKATMLGPIMAIPLEFPPMICRAVDIVLPERGTPQEQRLVKLLVTELTSDSREPVVALRGNHRWVRTLEATRFDGEDAGGPGLRQAGVYLISGGMGGIGLVLANHLARSVQAKLILIGRSAFPERNAWESWLATHESDDPTTKKIGELLALEGLGSQVMVAQADVTDKQQMQAVIAQTQEQFGKINGVIHAAGVLGNGIIQLRTSAEIEKVLQPKVKGTLVLDALLKNAPLDFFLVCSSINSVMPTPGRVDYMAANAFLDAYAQYYDTQETRATRTSQDQPDSNGCRHIAVNWDTWQEVGMGVNVEVPAHLRSLQQETMTKGLSPKQGSEAFNRILHHRVPQVVVSRLQLEAILRSSQPAVVMQATEGESPVATQQSTATSAQTRALHSRPNLRSSYVAPRDDTERTIVEIWQSLLGIELIGINDNFFELGGHSLMATQVVSRLRDVYQVEVQLRSLFEATTIAELAERLRTILWATKEREPMTTSLAGEREEFEI